MVDNEHLLLVSVGPVKYSGNVGTPAMVRDALIAVSKTKEISKEELELQIEENTKKIFPKIF